MYWACFARPRLYHRFSSDFDFKIAKFKVGLTLFPLGKDTFYHTDRKSLTKPRVNRVDIMTIFNIFSCKHYFLLQAVVQVVKADFNKALSFCYVLPLILTAYLVHGSI